MASHFKWYPSSEESTIQWNARYSYPSQANKAQKMTPRIPPKNGSLFNPGQVIRLEFPAQGYINPLHTTLEFDVTLYAPVNSNDFGVRFQNNIQSIFNRVRLLYGSTPSEDIQNYNVIVRALTEWTSTNQQGTMDQTSISEGIGGITWGAQEHGDFSGGGNTLTQGMVNVRQAFIQGCEDYNDRPIDPETENYINIIGTYAGGGHRGVPQGTSKPSGSTGNGNNYSTTRRYQVNFALGVFTQDKLIPTKFMASQLAIEITLEQAAACIYQPFGRSTNSADPTYSVGNVNLIPEILEFDDSYDEKFLQGLQEGGIPIKFSSWHYFQFTTQGSSALQLQIQERSRSVKAIFAVQRRNPPDFQYDSHALLYDTSTNQVSSTLQSYQYRIGGRYFPAAPVQCSSDVGGKTSNGGCEAFVELQKALNIVGDYRLSSSTNTLRWARPSAGTGVALYNEHDFSHSLTAYDGNGVPKPAVIESNLNCFAGNEGSGVFACAADFETSNGIEISGLNAEEQSDISFLVNWSASQAVGFSIECFVYYDAMWVLRPNNYLDLIQ